MVDASLVGQQLGVAGVGKAETSFQQLRVGLALTLLAPPKPPQRSNLLNLSLNTQHSALTNHTFMIKFHDCKW